MRCSCEEETGFGLSFTDEPIHKPIAECSQDPLFGVEMVCLVYDEQIPGLGFE